MRSLIPGLSIVFIVIIGGAIYFNYDQKRKERIKDQLREEYPPVTIEKNINGKIKSIYHGNLGIFRNSPHHAYILLKDSTKLQLHASYELTHELSLDEILQVGDFLVKESGTNTFLVYRIENSDTLIFNFELNDDLGYPLKKKE